MSQDSSTILLPCFTRLILLATSLLIGQGCASSKPQDTHSIVFYQVRFDLPWKVDPKEVYASRPKSPSVGFKTTGNGHVLELLDGQLKLDGKLYGTVKATDLVKVTEDGKVFVNEEERQPGDA